jgi:hypothetical protein
VLDADRAHLELPCRYLPRRRRLRTGSASWTIAASCSLSKTAWADGTRHLVFEPLTLFEKLAALTPRPRIDLVLSHGVLVPNAA